MKYRYITDVSLILLVKKCVFLYYQKNFCRKFGQTIGKYWKVFTPVLARGYERNNSNLFETMLFGDFE